MRCFFFADNVPHSKIQRKYGPVSYLVFVMENVNKSCLDLWIIYASRKVRLNSTGNHFVRISPSINVSRLLISLLKQ
jgi:hypothetical protein